MANLGSKDGIYIVRFRYRNKEYKRSLKTRDFKEAKCGLHVVEQVIHRLLTGQLEVPDGVDAGDYIVSGGKVKANRQRRKPPTVKKLIEEYLASHKHRLADTYYSSQRTHLRHLECYLGTKATMSSDRITSRDLEGFLEKRLAERGRNTVGKERTTIRLFFAWGAREYLDRSPAAQLQPIKDQAELPPFLTMQEVEEILVRGGLQDKEERLVWERVYLGPIEIAELLQTVKEKDKDGLAYMLHAIPAYTGMRRGEVLRLKWFDINLDHRTITARSRKQSRSKRESTRIIDVHSELADLLERWRKRRIMGQYLICHDNKDEQLTPDEANRAFWRPMRKTKWCIDSNRNLFKIGFHTYRHSFASNLAARGIDQRIIDQWMGHQTEAMRRRYRHLFPENRRRAIECFSLARD